MSFICDDCRSGAHDKCPGGTWCDCLHRQPKTAVAGAGQAGGGR